MRWTPGGDNEDIEDRRDETGGGSVGGGGFGGGRVGIGGLIVLGLLSLIFGRDFISPFLGGGSPAPVERRPDPVRSEREKPQKDFVGFVLGDAQKTWEGIFPSLGVPYRHAKLVLFRDAVDTACGGAESATGPFYCPGDEKVYIDLGFFDELARRFGAPGQFAQAYVLAHELGHHVQKLVGTEAKVRRAQQANPQAAKALSVRMELQADCYAGIWGHSTQERNILEEGDVDQGLAAAAAVGDDRLQKAAGRRVSPENFTHGSSAQRVAWFRKGFSTGDFNACNTFAREQE